MGRGVYRRSRRFGLNERETRMTNPNVRSSDEIDDLLAKAYDIKDNEGTRFRGMSFEDGITSTLEWIKGDSDEPVFGEED